MVFPLDRDVFAKDGEDWLERRWLIQLSREAQEILRYYRLKLSVPLLQLSRDRHRLGTYDSQTHTLQISSYLLREHPWDTVLEILKHELAHALVAYDAIPDRSEHGPLFQAACRRLGVAAWARQAQVEINPYSAQENHRQLSPEHERLLKKVEKLLSLANSGSGHEATLAMQRAKDYMARHQLEEHEQERVYTYVVIDHKKKQVPSHQLAISGILCQHFYVECILRNLYDAIRDQHTKALEIMGTRENVQMAEYVYWFLWHQLPLLWQRHCEEQQQRKGSRLQRRSFYLGVLNGFHEKLRGQSEGHDTIHSPHEGLILSENEKRRLMKREERRLQSYVRERYPFLSRRSQQQQGLAVDDYRSGRRRGRELHLNRGLTEQKQERKMMLEQGRD